MRDMFFPLNTNAPIYHYPFATIGLIIVNAVMFFATIGLVVDAEHVESVLWLTLEFDKVTPLQSADQQLHACRHSSPGGKHVFPVGVWAGHRRQAGLVAILLSISGRGADLRSDRADYYAAGLGRDRPGLGSVGLFGLMAIAVVWAPQSEMNCFMWAGIFSRIVQISIITFGLIYLAFQVFFFIISGYRMSSEALDLTGLLVGLPIGALLLKLNWVDCEGEDLFSVYGWKPKKSGKRQTGHDRPQVERPGRRR